MYLIFGKGVVGERIEKLATMRGYETAMLDYKERDEELITKAEKIIIHQAVPPTHEIYKKHRQKIQCELDFLYTELEKQGVQKNFQRIGITGTDGKSSVTRLIYNTLNLLLPSDNIWITGNFEKSVGEIIYTIISQNKIHEKNILVVEASSFMLYNISQCKFDYSLRTNISPDHLNRHTDMEDYIQAKVNLFLHTTKQCFGTIHIHHIIPFYLRKKFQVYADTYNLTLTHFVGKHNAENIEGTFLLVKKFLADENINITDQQIKSVINTIHPLHHRCDLVKTIGEIKIIDDGKSTTSQSLKAALESFSEPVVLIAGGSDKGDNFDHLETQMKKNLGYGVFMGTTGPLLAGVADRANCTYTSVATMRDAVTTAYEKAKELGINIILFSPGSASFDMFKNREERVNLFLNEVENINKY